ncbi:hypothetical protein BPTFM16_01528 [Altererythrobacter insulae]|nr:hypothetical protein BPTFM16_01528 [Altererythrobacter insulae]
MAGESADIVFTDPPYNVANDGNVCGLGGKGAFYRSKHKLILVFKQGTAANTNSFGLGETGRYRTNVWDYAGISSITTDRSDEPAMHPTVKPVALIADALRDNSRRSEMR